MGVAASRQEAFWEACGFGHTDRVKKFLEDGDIDVNWISYTHDCCAIHVASQGKPEIVKMLIKAKCNVNVKDVRGNLPLHHAAMKGHDDIIEMLIAAGSEINTGDKNGWTPLHCAAYWNHPKSVKVLLKNNADAKIQNKDERTALHETARSQERDDFKLGEIARCLIDAGADVNAKSSDLGEADFTGLMFASYHNHPDVASAFIDASCDIDAFGTNRWTALHWAADRGNDELVFLLLEAGADPTIKGWRNERAVDRAQNPEIKEVLTSAITMFEELSLLDKRPPASEVSKTSSFTESSKKSSHLDIIETYKHEQKTDADTPEFDKQMRGTDDALETDKHIQKTDADTPEPDKHIQGIDYELENDKHIPKISDSLESDKNVHKVEEDAPELDKLVQRTDDTLETDKHMPKTEDTLESDKNIQKTGVSPESDKHILKSEDSLEPDTYVQGTDDALENDQTCTEER